MAATLRLSAPCDTVNLALTDEAGWLAGPAELKRLQARLLCGDWALLITD